MSAAFLTNYLSGFALPPLPSSTARAATTSSTTSTRACPVRTSCTSSTSTTSTIVGWNPTKQVPLAFGPVISSSGDILAGPADAPLWSTGAMKFRFSIPSQQPSIKVAVVAKTTSTLPSAPLKFTLYSDVNGSPGSTVLASGSLTPSHVPTTIGWTPFVSLTPASGNLAAGYYWLFVASPASTSSAHYLGYMNFAQSWTDFYAFAGYQPAPGYGANSGFSMTWVQDSAGNDLTILPYGQSITPPSSQTFVADSTYWINNLCPWLSDQHFIFKPNPASLTLTDVTTGQVLGTAPASQYYNGHGNQGVIPFQLLAPVLLTAGHTYQITVNDPLVVYRTLLRGSTCNPVKAAPAGKSPYWWGEIALADFTAYRVLDYPGLPGRQTPDGFDPIGMGKNGNGRIAVRFVPNSNETLTSVKLKLKNFNASGNYAAGTPVVVSVYAGNDNASGLIGATPTGSSLGSVTVDSGTLPTNGWWQVSGLNVNLTKGQPCWIVWSCPTAGTGVAFYWQRDVSPYRFLCEFSHDGGTTWGYFAEGPSEFSWAATLTKETIGNPFDDTDKITIDSSYLLAQPFILSKDATMTCVYAFFGGPTNSFGSTNFQPHLMNASIYPDNGSGTGPNMTGAPLGKGSFNTLLRYVRSSVILPLDTPAALKANTKYWIVYSTTNGTGWIGIDYYWMRPTDPHVPVGYDALLSSNGGATWHTSVPAGDVAATTLFMVGMEVAGTSHT